jgi:phosphatidylserine synthase
VDFEAFDKFRDWILVKYRLQLKIDIFCACGAIWIRYIDTNISEERAASIFKGIPPPNSAVSSQETDVFVTTAVPQSTHGL